METNRANVSESFEFCIIRQIRFDSSHSFINVKGERFNGTYG